MNGWTGMIPHLLFLSTELLSAQSLPGYAIKIMEDALIYDMNLF